MVMMMMKIFFHFASFLNDDKSLIDFTELDKFEWFSPLNRLRFASDGGAGNSS